MGEEGLEKTEVGELVSAKVGGGEGLDDATNATSNSNKLYPPIHTYGQKCLA
jgi:hypothetical protein